MKKAIAMKCSQEDWDSIKGSIPEDKIGHIGSFDEYLYLANNFNENGIISNTNKSNCFPYEYHETFNAKIFIEACGIEFDKKFEITKEQIIEMASWGNSIDNEKVKEWFPEAFKKDMEVGIWYKDTRTNSKALFYLEEIIEHNTNGMKSYGFSMTGDWMDSSNRSNDVFEKFVRLATTQEVKTALINEAEKRGFVNGAYFNEISDKYNNSSISPTGHCGSEYRLENNILYVLGRGKWCVFKGGKWATIIETITIQEAEKLLNKKIV